MSPSRSPKTLVCWKDIVAVGLSSGDIIILNEITGTCKSTLSGHTDEVNSLDFSFDGAMLVSGSNDTTVKLWDIQTGGVIKTFHNHTNWVQSVSISPDCTVIASGAKDRTICIWDLQTGGCCHTIGGHNSYITFVCFSPTNSQLLISASGGTIYHWDINGHQIGPVCSGDALAFSSDGAYFVSWRGNFAMVRNSDSGVVLARLHIPFNSFHCCCFSPNGRFIAGAVGDRIYIWNITGPDPCLVETFGHSGNITSITFSSSSLISASQNRSVKFWQISSLSMNLIEGNPIPIPPTSVSIQSVSLQVEDGIAISSDSDGVVRTWNISTGFCEASFQTPAKGRTWRDSQMIDGKLILIWFADKKIHIWDTKKDELLQQVDVLSTGGLWDLRISGDGAKVFFADGSIIKAWSIWTGEVMGEVRLEGNLSPHSLSLDGSKIWVHIQGSSPQGWDFGVSGLPPVLLSNMSPNRPRLDLFDGTKRQNTTPSRVKDTVTGKEVFRLYGRYAKPTRTQWDGRYLIAGYNSGEVLILDFIHMIPV